MNPETSGSQEFSSFMEKTSLRSKAHRWKAGGHSLRFPVYWLLAATLFAEMAWSSPQAEQPATPNKGAVSSAAQNSRSAGDNEHWNVLPLAANHLRASIPLLGEKDIQPEFTRELYQVQWRRDDPIDLYIVRPAKVAKPPVALLLYGYPSTTDRFLDDAYCRSIVSRGFAAIGFVSALTGHRYHDRPMKEWFVSELPQSLGASVHDVQMILNYLESRSDLDMTRVGMYGQGSGGTIAILAASNDKRIKAVDVLDPWGDWPDWIAKSPIIPEEERPALLAPGFLGSVASLDPVDWLPQLSSRPFRLQQTKFSQITPANARNRIHASLPPSAEQLIYKDVHDYEQKAILDSNIFTWLQQQLQKEDGSDQTHP